MDLELRELRSRVSRLVETLVNRGDEAIHGRQLPQARAFFEAAALADRSSYGPTCLAIHLASCGLLEVACSQLETALEHARRAQCPRERLVCCHNLAVFHRRHGQPVDAQQYVQLAIAAWLECSVDGDATRPSWLPQFHDPTTTSEAFACFRRRFTDPGVSEFPVSKQNRQEPAAEHSSKSVSTFGLLAMARREGDRWAEAELLERYAAGLAEQARWTEAIEVLKEAGSLYDLFGRFNARQRCDTRRCQIRKWIEGHQVCPEWN